MNCVCVFSFTLFSAISSLAHANLWHTDYSQVQSISKQENKPVLIFFNGSDWSGEAMWMKREILDTPSFQEKVRDHLICMEADFPEHMQLPELVSAQNQALKNEFLVEHTPTLLLLDPHARVIAQLGYLPESGDQLAHDLLRLLEQDAKLTAGLARGPTQGSEWIQLYQIAQELGREQAQETILEAGLKNKDPYFFLEKYRLLTEKGDTERAQALRAQLALLDPDNSQGVHFTLALIDFQALADKKQNPDTAVLPLITYIERFGAKDPHNLWRIEMMIAQHYMEADLKEKALSHAERALRVAPDQMHDEIAHSLDYIRSSSVSK